MTSSNGHSDRLDLNRDLPTTPEDVAAQKRLVLGRPLSSEEYLRFLAIFDPVPPEELRRKGGPRGESPFQLLPSIPESRR